MLRGLVKLLLVAGAAGAAGLLLGLGVSKLTGGGDAQTPIGAASPTGLGSRTSTGQSTAANSPPNPPQSAPPNPAPQSSLAQVRVRAFSAILHPAATAAGRQRQRARLNVRIVVRNGGKLLVTPARPTLLVAGTSVETDPKADAPGTRLGPLDAGRTAHVTLQFELAGALTTQLTNQQKARVVVAGHSLTVAVSLGPPVAAATGKPGG